MKRIAFFAMLVLVAVSCSDKFSVSGNWPQGQDKKLSLEMIKDGDTTVIATTIPDQDGNFILEGKLPYSQKMALFADGYKTADLFVGKTPIVIDLDTHMGMKEMVTTSKIIECGPEQKAMEAGVSAVVGYSLMQLALPSAFNKMFENAKSQEEIDSLMKAFNDSQRLVDKMAYDYLDSTSNNAGCLYAFQTFLMYLPADSMSMRFDRISDDIKKSHLGKETAALVKKAISVSVNGTPDNFVLMSNKGEAVSLNSFRGNYLLMDFWASWCHPCREEMPVLKSIYEQFHSKGLEILSVSIDDDEAAWKNAIEELELPWVHVSSLKGSRCPVATDFGVTGVPRIFILDPDGKIIADGLRGDDLVKFVTELY